MKLKPEKNNYSDIFIYYQQMSEKIWCYLFYTLILHLVSCLAKIIFVKFDHLKDSFFLT